jgi:hypothetical protein
MRATERRDWYIATLRFAAYMSVIAFLVLFWGGVYAGIKELLGVLCRV